MIWLRCARGLCRALDEPRRSELLGHLEDVVEAGVTPTALETASILVLVLRHRVQRASRELPAVLAGLPLAGLWLIAYGMVYEEHFLPWDMMEDTPSRPGLIATLRLLVSHGWLASVPFAVVAGWQAARRLARGSFLLPAIYVGALFVLIAQADLFIEHNPWFGRDLQVADVDAVSPEGLALALIALLLPVAFVVADRVVGTRQPRVSLPMAVRPVVSTVPGGQVDRLGLAAVASPLLMLVGQHLAWVLFLVFTWLSPAFSRGLKMVASLAVAVPGALVMAVVLAEFDALENGTDDPGGLIVAIMALELGVWLWMVARALGLRIVSAGSPSGPPAAEWSEPG